MKKHTRIANLGTVDFSKIELMDSYEIYIDIAELSVDLKEEVEKAVEKGKKIHEETDKAYMEIWGQNWSKTGVKTIPQLHIILPIEGKIQYELSVYYQDLEDDGLSDCVILEIDLTNHMLELRKIILHVLIDRFF
ncbi:hypothetical protein [Hungatella effluvii]|uniref:hypothetical protein n=1 Tax=Hungatella effluvii TaxID=1096246 RepID=UPI0022E49A4B|nr:hypothetical protein [Hungatella effluvii]